MARLFTVVIEASEVVYVSFDGPDMWPVYECDFAGIHFSRNDEAILKIWVRKAAKNVYGPNTQVIFLHTER
jgi:hypothetical protein